MNQVANQSPNQSTNKSVNLRSSYYCSQLESAQNARTLSFFKKPLKVHYYFIGFEQSGYLAALHLATLTALQIHIFFVRVKSVSNNCSRSNNNNTNYRAAAGILTSDDEPSVPVNNDILEVLSLKNAVPPSQCIPYTPVGNLTYLFPSHRTEVVQPHRSFPTG